jgi:small-conductance mechanosensitive channel
MDSRAISALIALAAGIAVGALVGWAVRRIVQRRARRPEVREIGRALGIFLFWLAVAAGAVIAAGLLRPGTFAQLPNQVLEFLPRVLVAGLIVIAGYALAATLAAAFSAGLARAAGRTQRQGAIFIRAVVVGAAVLLALAQLGINTTIITLLVAALAFGAAAAMALLIGIGSRDVARNIAAGRYLHRVLRIGDEVKTGDVHGTVVALHPATLELNTGIDRTIHVPNADVLAGNLEIRRGSASGRAAADEATDGLRRARQDRADGPTAEPASARNPR